MSYNDDNSHLHRPLFDAVAFASPRVNKQKLKQVKQLRLNSDYPTVPEVKVTKKQLHIQDMDKRKLTLQKELETKLSIEYFPNPYIGYQMHTQADITKSKQKLNFKPKFSLEDGIRAYISEIKRLHGSSIL